MKKIMKTMNNLKTYIIIFGLMVIRLGLAPYISKWSAGLVGGEL